MTSYYWVWLLFLFLQWNNCACLSPIIKPQNKIITISSSGTHGYYLLGITSYLKDNFDLSEYVFSGASSGSWISLIMTYKGNHDEIIEDILKISNENKGSIRDLGKGLKNLFLNSGKYKNTDFDLKKCYIGVININVQNFMETKTFIYNNFSTLEDAVNCCIASSHVPFVMGNMFRKYRDRYMIDGGFSNNPYYGNGHVDGNCLECDIDRIPKIADLHVHPFIWYKRPVFFMEYLSNQFKLFLDLFILQSMDFTKMYHNGYEDAKKHHENFCHFKLKNKIQSKWWW
jgi:hypothetical protein